jgi:hypothetical protein
MNTKPDSEASPYVTNILNRTHTSLPMDDFVRNLHGHAPHLQNVVDAQILLGCAHYRFTGKALNGFKQLYFPHYCAGAGTAFSSRFLSGWTEDCSYRTVRPEVKVRIFVNFCVHVCTSTLCKCMDWNLFVVCSQGAHTYAPAFEYMHACTLRGRKCLERGMFVTCIESHVCICAV